MNHVVHHGRGAAIKMADKLEYDQVINWGNDVIVFGKSGTDESYRVPISAVGCDDNRALATTKGSGWVYEDEFLATIKHGK